MGPNKLRGLGDTRRGISSLAYTAPLTPESGAGGPGVLNTGKGKGETARGVSFTPALDEIGDVTTGRITLGLVNLSILALIGFYVWTRSAQGGG